VDRQVAPVPCEPPRCSRGHQSGRVGRVRRSDGPADRVAVVVSCRGDPGARGAHLVGLPAQRTQHTSPGGQSDRSEARVRVGRRPSDWREPPVGWLGRARPNACSASLSISSSSDLRNAPEREHRSPAPERRAVAPWRLPTERRMSRRPADAAGCTERPISSGWRRCATPGCVGQARRPGDCNWDLLGTPPR
jgi:hypothetical protein